MPLGVSPAGCHLQRRLAQAVLVLHLGTIAQEQPQQVGTVACGLHQCSFAYVVPGLDVSTLLQQQLDDLLLRSLRLRVGAVLAKQPALKRQELPVQGHAQTIFRPLLQMAIYSVFCPARPEEKDHNRKQRARRKDRIPGRCLAVSMESRGPEGEDELHERTQGQ